LATALNNVRKHVGCQALNKKEALWEIKVALIMAGSEKKLRERPIIFSGCCPVASLTFEKRSIEAYWSSLPE